MKKTLALLLALALLAALFTGCGPKPEPAPTTPAATQTDIDSAPKTAEPEETEPEPAAEPETEPEQEPESEPEPEEPEPEPEEPARSLVEGNPGQFLRVGDEIFFRVFDTTKAGVQSFPDFLQSWHDSDWRAGLWAYDEAEGSLRCLADGVDGYSYISYGAGGLLFPDNSSQESPYSDVQLISTEGELLHTFKESAVSKVDPQGRYMALWVYNPEQDFPDVWVYEGVNPLYRLEKSDGYANVCGFGPQGEAVCLDAVYNDEDYSYTAVLWQQGADGRRLELGSVDFGEWGSYPNVEQFELNEETGRFYLVLSYFQGVAAGNSYVVARGALGEENGVEIVRTFDGSEDEALPVPGVFMTQDGFGITRRRPNTVYLSDGDSGDLMAVDAEGDEFMLLEDFIDPETGHGFILQAAAFLDEAAYLIVADAQRRWSSGWGWEYELLELYYLRVPADNPRVETLLGTRWTGVTAAEYVEEPAPIEPEYVGTWTLFADDADGEQVPVEDGYESYITIDYFGWADFVSGGYQQDFTEFYRDVNQYDGPGWVFTDPSTEDNLFVTLVDEVTMKLTFVHREDGEIISVYKGYYAYEPAEGAPDFSGEEGSLYGAWTIFAGEVEGSVEDVSGIDSYVYVYGDGTADYMYDGYYRYFPYCEAVEEGNYDGTDALSFSADDTEDLLYVFMKEEGVLGASLLYHDPSGDSWSWTGFYHRDASAGEG